MRSAWTPDLTIAPFDLSYSLSDFVMFSARVYDRQVALYNVDHAGLQAVAMLAGACLVWQTARPSGAGQRAIPVVLGLAWLWVAWSFLWQRYGDVNEIARIAAPVFALQGLALLAAALRSDGLGVRLPEGFVRPLALTLLVLTLVLYPALAPVSGKPNMSAEFFGLMPDPTALGTLVVLAFSSGWIRFALAVVPAIWCALSAATLSVLGSPMVWVVATTALATLMLLLLRHR